MQYDSPGPDCHLALNEIVLDEARSSGGGLVSTRHLRPNFTILTTRIAIVGVLKGLAAGGSQALVMAPVIVPSSVESVVGRATVAAAGRAASSIPAVKLSGLADTLQSTIFRFDVTGSATDSFGARATGDSQESDSLEGG